LISSSRRRHTSWPRDWSSDVCSSDLANSQQSSPCRCHRHLRADGLEVTMAATWRVLLAVCLTVFVTVFLGLSVLAQTHAQTPARSEERRVGKERRSRASPSKEDHTHR